MLQSSMQAMTAGATSASSGISLKRLTTGKCLARSCSRIRGEFALLAMISSVEAGGALQHHQAGGATRIFDIPRGKLPPVAGIGEIRHRRILQNSSEFFSLRVIEGFEEGCKQKTPGEPHVS
jgi:hypothetical protein